MRISILRNKEGRILFIAVAIGIMYGGMVYCEEENQQRHAMIRLIEKEGGVVEKDESAEYVTAITIPCASDRRKEILQNLHLFPELKSLNLVGCELDENVIQIIVALPNLAELNLSATNIDDVMLANIGKMSSLRQIWLAHTYVTEKGIQQLPDNIRIFAFNTRIDTSKLKEDRIFGQDLCRLPSPIELIDIGRDLTRSSLRSSIVLQSMPGIFTRNATVETHCEGIFPFDFDHSDKRPFMSIMFISITEDQDVDWIRDICKATKSLADYTTCTIELSASVNGSSDEIKTQYLEGLSQTTIAELNLDVHLTEHDFELLSVWPSLRALNIDAYEEDDFQELAPYCLRLSSLESLGFNLGMLDDPSNVLPDDFFTRLGELKKLTSFYLRYVQISTRQVEYVGQLHQLVNLSFENCSLTDEDIKFIARLPNLETLNLSSTEVTDESAELLAAMPKLRWLNVRDTGISEEGLKTLSRSKSLKEVLK